MSPAPHDHDPAARRAALLDAADRVIREAGPDASMTAIAAAAGITKPILYRHFGDKGGLYRALAERYAGPMLEQLVSILGTYTDRQERMRVMMSEYFRLIEEDPEIYRFLMHRALREQPEVATSIAGLTSVVAAGIAETIKREMGLDDRHDAAVRAWAHGIVGLVQLSGDWWLETRLLSREELVHHLSALLWSGLDGLTADSAVVRGLVQ